MEVVGKPGAVGVGLPRNGGLGGRDCSVDFRTGHEGPGRAGLGGVAGQRSHGAAVELEIVLVTVVVEQGLAKDIAVVDPLGKGHIKGLLVADDEVVAAAE